MKKKAGLDHFFTTPLFFQVKNRVCIVSPLKKVSTKREAPEKARDFEILNRTKMHVFINASNCPTHIDVTEEYFQMSLLLQLQFQRYTFYRLAKDPHA
uniref:Uncharacterized protein n=1 Tax=Romanomermis culicivorax TaxID=13658 RepID=A0A915HLK1_ROMCU